MTPEAKEVARVLADKVVELEQYAEDYKTIADNHRQHALAVEAKVADLKEVIDNLKVAHICEIADLQEKLKKSESDRDAFQTQAWARRRECFELKAHVLLLVEGLKEIASEYYNEPARQYYPNLDEIEMWQIAKNLLSIMNELWSVL